MFISLSIYLNYILGSPVELVGPCAIMFDDNFAVATCQKPIHNGTARKGLGVMKRTDFVIALK